LVPFGWGFLDQVLSSATTFLLTIAGARALGPDGLGVVVIGWGAFLAVLGLQRALITRTLTAVSAAAAAHERHRSAAGALTLTLALAGATAATFTVVGLSWRGAVGEGLLLFAPWVAPALVQDFLRSVLFRDGRAAAAAASDAAWLGVSMAAFLAAMVLSSRAAVAGAWGIGGAAGMVVGFACTRLRPTAPAAAVTWWRAEAWALSRWLGSEAVFYSAAATATMIALTTLLGASAIGALRAAQSLFAPLSILGPAVGLPGLPALVRAAARSPSAQLKLAGQISGAVAALTAAYVLVASTAGVWLMPVVFGSSFRPYGYLALPIGIWQLIVGSGIGLSLLLTARREGAKLFVVRLVESSAIFLLAIEGAMRFGLKGAAWGYAAGAGVGLIVLVFWTLRSCRSDQVAPATPVAMVSGSGPRSHP
jgi:O-antigen/teichoic acid export membrane protein